MGSQSHVESFNVKGQAIAVGTQVDLEPRVKAASVEATLLVEDQGAGTWHARFTVQNVTDERPACEAMGARRVEPLDGDRLKLK